MLLEIRDSKIREQTIVKENGESVVIDVVQSVKERGLQADSCLHLGNASGAGCRRVRAALTRDRGAVERITAGKSPMRGLERRLRRIEQAIPNGPCPVHPGLGVYVFWAEQDCENKAAALRRELSECPNCSEGNPLFLMFGWMDKGDSTAPKVDENLFTLDLGEPAPEMLRITFNRFDTEDLN